MGSGRMDEGRRPTRPTRAEVEAMKQWASLGEGDSVDGDRENPADKTYSEGRIVISGSNSEIEQRIEDKVEAHEQAHAEKHVEIMRAFGGSLAFSHAVGEGPWATSARSRKNKSPREDENTSDFEPDADEREEYRRVWGSSES